MGDTVREVRVGDRNIVVPRFNGYKATVAGEIIATITKKAPEINSAVAAFTRKYESENATRVTKAQARLERYMRVEILYDDNDMPRETELGTVAVERKPIFSDADFGDREFIEIPSSPSTQEQFMAIFPMVYEVAKDEVIRLLALVTIPNNELAEADEEGVVPDVLQKHGKKLLHEADIDQLLEVFGVALDVLSDQFSGKGGSAGKAVAWIRSLIRSNDEPAPTKNDPENESEQSLSIDSPEPTDGEEETHSIAQVGAS